MPSPRVAAEAGARKSVAAEPRCRPPGSTLLKTIARWRLGRDARAPLTGWLGEARSSRPPRAAPLRYLIRRQIRAVSAVTYAACPGAGASWSPCGRGRRASSEILGLSSPVGSPTGAPWTKSRSAAPRSCRQPWLRFDGRVLVGRPRVAPRLGPWAGAGGGLSRWSVLRLQLLRLPIFPRRVYWRVRLECSCEPRRLLCRLWVSKPTHVRPQVVGPPPKPTDMPWVVGLPPKLVHARVFLARELNLRRVLSRARPLPVHRKTPRRWRRQGRYTVDLPPLPVRERRCRQRVARAIPRTACRAG